MANLNKVTGQEWPDSSNNHGISGLEFEGLVLWHFLNIHDGKGGGEILELCFYGWKGWVNEKHVNFSYKHLVIIVIYNKYTFHIHKKVSLFKPWILEIFVCFPEKQQFRRQCKI